MPPAPLLPPAVPAPRRAPPPPPPEALRAERARRAAVRGGVLAGLPRPGSVFVTKPSRSGGSRPDLWPPPPELPPRVGSRTGSTYTRGFLINLIRRFAEARGPGFGILEFARWSGVNTGTLYRRVGSWPACRAAAGLPRHTPRKDTHGETLHRLLETLHRNRARRTPLTGPALAQAAGVSRSTITAHGGVHHLRDLYRLWATDPAAQGGGERA